MPCPLRSVRLRHPLPRRLSCLSTGVAHPAGSPRHTAYRLAGSLPDSLSHPSNRLSESLAKLADALTEALAKLAYALTELADRTAWSERLSCRIGQSAQCLARRSARLDRLLCSLSDVIERLCQTAARPERLLAELADIADRVVDRLDEAFKYLGVPVKRRKRPIKDVVKVL